MIRLALSCLALAAAAAAPWQALGDDEPLRPEDAFRYAVTEAGGAVEVDWIVEDGYYLYRNKLGFDSATPGVVLGTADLPEGIEHEDEFFGQQEIYRGRFTVRVPYAVQGERPPSFELVIKSQGCADLGLCYPPQIWTADIALRSDPATSKPRPDVPAGDRRAAFGDYLPPDEAFRPALSALDGNTVEVSWRIADGYYLYKDRISVATASDEVRLGRLELPEGKTKVDQFFGESEVYYDEVSGRLPLARTTPAAMPLELELVYQGCAEDGLCYPPIARHMTVELPEAGVVTPLEAAAPVSEQGRLAALITESSIVWVVASFFGIGLLLSLTPCVLPMVPILTSIIAGEGDETNPVRGFTLALSYVAGMSIVYTAAGVVAVAAGMQVQAAFNQPWVLTIFAGLFVLLSIAMFGGYDLQMPSAVQSRLAILSGNQKSGTTVGAFIMGALSALIVTACVAPALIAALTVMAQTGDMLRGGVSLFAMSLGMGAPLLIVGAAQGHLLPRAGPWMVSVKNAFGFMLLGLAVWMLSRMLAPEITLALWGVLVFMIGVFLGGLTMLDADSSGRQKAGKGFGVLGMVYGLLLLLSAMAGGTSPLNPLKGIDLGGGVTVAEDHGLEFRRIKTVADLDRELDAAARDNRTAMLDFYADWCVSCKEMEAYTFTDPRVQSALSDTVLLQADVTKNDAEDQELLERFGVFGPPTIIFFGKDGRRRQGYEVVGYMKAEAFAEHVEQAFAASPTVTAAE